MKTAATTPASTENGVLLRPMLLLLTLICLSIWALFPQGGDKPEENVTTVSSSSPTVTPTRRTKVEEDDLLIESEYKKKILPSLEGSAMEANLARMARELGSDKLELPSDSTTTLSEFQNTVKDQMQESIERLKAKSEKTPTPQATDDPLFTREELKQLGQEPTVAAKKSLDNLLAGVTSRGTVDLAAPTPAPVKTAEPEPTPEEEEVKDVTEFTGQTRGYVMLYLMHPKARGTVERQIENLLASKIREIYLAVLSDGTFGKDLAYLSQVIRRLSVDGRVLTLALYLTNGASQRHYDVTPIDAGFVRVNPEDFRSLIQHDFPTQQKFVAMVKSVLPIFQLNTRLNRLNSNIAIVMLEDNLDTAAYLQMRELAQLVLGNLVQFVRNPCQGCLPGNDSNTVGDPIEVHKTYELPQLSKRDGYTLDGEGYYFPWEPKGRSSFPIADVLALEQTAIQQGIRYFGLWRGARQGLQGGVTVHPDQRTYETPTDEQLAIEIKMLRHALTPKATSPESIVDQPAP
ncbi:hypothetical protein OAO01_08190 [Oligoflexia bacterium]|nr:hypothetical protein [Oligoflexia bacterium]